VLLEALEEAAAAWRDIFAELLDVRLTRLAAFLPPGVHRPEVLLALHRQLAAVLTQALHDVWTIGRNGLTEPLRIRRARPFQ
jgi:hypothetical protein